MRILAAPAFANEKVNPYNASLYRELNKCGSDAGLEIAEYSHAQALKTAVDLVHFHWPDGYINQRGLAKSWQRILLLGLVICILKLKGCKLVWTVHNTSPHDALRPRLSRRFMQWFVHRCDGFIFMSQGNKAAFFKNYSPTKKSSFAIIPHGHYRACYPAAINQHAAKQQLELNPDQKVLLCVGMIKPYKNIPALMQIFHQATLTDYQLVIAGAPDTAALREALEQLKQPNIHLFLRFIPDSELNLYMSAADIVILPYKAIINSGALLLALSYSRPVIAPNIGAFDTLQQELGEKWVYTYANDLQPQTLILALTELQSLERPEICPLDNYDWSKLALLTMNFYQSLFNPSLSTNTQDYI